MNKPEHNYPPKPEQSQPEQDLIGPDVYYWPRTHPERLNWGEHMTAAQLKDAGLAANRVPIPGDWDYIQRSTN